MTATTARAVAARQGTRVELRGVVKEFAGHRALAGVDLALEPGELVALLGPSGCGKTTALRCLAGLEEVSAGSILLGGEDVAAVPTNRRDLGMVFQQYSLFPHMTVAENVEFGLRMRKAGTGERRRRAAEALELVGLGHLGGRYAHQLSGGQQQRVALARALVTRPRVLLLDEPLSALDAQVRVQLREEIRRLQTELGITTLFVTHDQEEALAVADRVAVMRAGVVEQVGTPEELYSTPATAFVAGFVGLSNRLPGHLADGVLTVLGAALAWAGHQTPDGPVTAYVRPEDLGLDEHGPVAGTVVASSFLGAVRRTQVRLDGGVVVVVQHDAADARQSGEGVHLTLRKRAVAIEPREATASA
ncbi:ABC transporter ATP-binding protein [Georgenia ruanii]|uniref:ABC-type quaternary amine transporter n=1 Tax=Georgenia ruanii TaxID=348442 RepID=A0A7J9UXN8_9MICO|nr:ABC transporter ATP-binding protein [Georgenia ruanii]MPV89386.1 ATP-binding cassette domain-containing protein [Georgenia ruanii]